MPLNFNTNYMNNFPQPAQIAFGRALQTWSAQLDSQVQIEISAIWAVNLPPNLIAMCIPNPVENFPNAPFGNCWYPSSLADKLAQQDLKQGEPDLTVFFGVGPWHTGVPNPPQGQYDLESVALHELGHGLGFISTFWVDGVGVDWPYHGNYGGQQLIALANHVVHNTGQQLGFQLPALNDHPSVYGLHVQDLAGSPLTAPGNYANDSTELGAALVSYNLFFDLNRAQLFAPNPFRPFVSIDHLTNLNSVMRYRMQQGVQNRVVDAPVLDILHALGW